MADPQKDEHIEELLSKLQGIFGKLSHSEEEESRTVPEAPAPVPQAPPPKADAPAMPPPVAIDTPPPSPAVPLTPPPALVDTPATPAAMAAEPVDAAPPAPIGVPAPPPMKEMVPPPPPPPPPSEAMAPPSPPPTPVANVGNYVSTVPVADPEKTIVPAALYFPNGRENEARIVAQKLETMTPKFTKVMFRLRVVVFTPYDPKSDWKEGILAARNATPFQTVFVLMDRPLDDAKRKAVAGDLEGKGVYFQDVMLAAIEKKAFYTDVLLGLVFFFDSHKPAPAPNA